MHCSSVLLQSDRLQCTLAAVLWQAGPSLYLHSLVKSDKVAVERPVLQSSSALPPITTCSAPTQPDNSPNRASMLRHLGLPLLLLALPQSGQTSRPHPAQPQVGPDSDMCEQINSWSVIDSRLNTATYIVDCWVLTSWLVATAGWDLCWTDIYREACTSKETPPGGECEGTSDWVTMAECVTQPKPNISSYPPNSISPQLKRWCQNMFSAFCTLKLHRQYILSNALSSKMVPVYPWNTIKGLLQSSSRGP